MKIIIVVFLFAIIAALFTAMFFLLNDDGSSKRTVNALTVRISLSLALIIFLLVSFFMGWIEPHGIIPPPPE